MSLSLWTLDSGCCSGLCHELFVCADEGVYVNTYGKITKNVVLQWGEQPTSVGESPYLVCVVGTPPNVYVTHPCEVAVCWRTTDQIC